MENEITSFKRCTGNWIGSHSFDYGKVGFSPCGEYVSHESNQPCAPLPVNTGSINLDNCQCKTEPCPCGDFVSHKVIEPCTATA